MIHQSTGQAGLVRALQNCWLCSLHCPSGARNRAADGPLHLPAAVSACEGNSPPYNSVRAFGPVFLGLGKEGVFVIDVLSFLG